MSGRAEERLAALADADKRAELRTAAVQRQRRRTGVPGRFVQWGKILGSKGAHERTRALQGRKLAEIGEAQGKHAADVMLDLALDEPLETAVQLTTRAPESVVALGDSA